jgi:hypothetical protein
MSTIYTMAYEYGDMVTLVAGVQREREEAAAASERDVDLYKRQSELSDRIFAAHHRAVFLAVSLIHHNGAPERTLVPGDEHTNPYYFTRSDPIKLGEQYPNDDSGLTYGFAIVGAIYRAHQLTRSRKTFPIFGRVITEVIGTEPTADITKVNVELLRGTADGGVTERLIDLSTAGSTTNYSTDPRRAEVQLTHLLGQRERTVQALEILADGGGIGIHP